MSLVFNKLLTKEMRTLGDVSKMTYRKTLTYVAFAVTNKSNMSFVLLYFYKPKSVLHWNVDHSGGFG